MRSEHAAVGVPGSPSGTGAVPRREVDAVFGALFTQHRHRVFSTALRLTGRPADAEDLTADTFLQAYRSLSGFDYERLDTLRPRAWLSAIVVNLWRNQCRAPSRRPRPAESPGAMGPVPVDPHPGVEEQIKTREDGRELAAALLTLPVNGSPSFSATSVACRLPRWPRPWNARRERPSHWSAGPWTASGPSTRQAMRQWERGRRRSPSARSVPPQQAGPRGRRP